MATLVAGPAWATLSIELLWTQNGGADRCDVLPGDTIGTNVIEADPGEEISLDVILTVDEAGVDTYSVSVVFDEDLLDELDIVEICEFEHVSRGIDCDPLIQEQIGLDCFDDFGPTLTNLSGGVTSADDSDGANAGLVVGFEASAPVEGPDAGPVNLSFRAGRIVFLVTDNVQSDGADLAGSLLSEVDGYLDNSLVDEIIASELPDPGLVPGFANVDAPEPSPSLLAAAGLGIVSMLRRARRAVQVR